MSTAYPTLPNEKITKTKNGGVIHSYSNVVETWTEQLMNKILDNLLVFKGWKNKDQLESMELTADELELKNLLFWYLEVYWKAEYVGIPLMQEVGFGGAHSYPNREKISLTFFSVCKIFYSARPSGTERHKFDQCMPWPIKIYFYVRDFLKG